MNLHNNIWLMVGSLHEDNPTYTREMLIERCKRGTESVGITWEQLQSKCRKGEIIDAKRLCTMYLRDKGWGLQEIATTLGLTNHTTAYHHNKVGKELLEYDPPFKKKYITFITS